MIIQNLLKRNSDILHKIFNAAENEMVVIQFLSDNTTRKRRIKRLLNVKIHIILTKTILNKHHKYARKEASVYT